MNGAVDAVAPVRWGDTLSDAPVLDAVIAAPVPALVRRWAGIAPGIEQAALDHHFLSIHLGGPKRLTRRGEGNTRCREVACGAYSVVPAGAAFHWNTEGPVDFMHVYFSPSAVGQVVAGAFDRDPARIALQESLGGHDPVIAALAVSLLDELAHDAAQKAYLDDVTHLLVCQMLRLHSNARSAGPSAPYLLAPFRLRRALDFIESHLGQPIGVAEIAAASGVSPYHFSRAFRRTMGRPPYAYLLDRRVAAAKALLADTTESLNEIARRCGFGSPSQFSRMFRRETGVAATRYRALR